MGERQPADSLHAMILLPLNTYPPGVTATPEVDVADDARGYLLEIARCTDQAPDVWADEKQVLRVQVELWIRGEWLPWGAFDAYGGKHMQRDGSIATNSWLRCRIGDAAPGRKLRAFLLAAAPVRTCIDLTVA